MLCPERKIGDGDPGYMRNLLGWLESRLAQITLNYLGAALLTRNLVCEPGACRIAPAAPRRVIHHGCEFDRHRTKAAAKQIRFTVLPSELLLLFTPSCYYDY